MNKPITFLAVVTLLIGASSCNDAPTAQQNQEQVSHDGTDNLTLQLNDGKRWKANTATTEGINNLTLLVDKFAESDSAATYIQLKTELEAEFTSIFKQCTMTGPAHDQLHNYLFPLKRLFNRLKSLDSEERLTAVKDLKVYLKEYAVYFE